MKTVQNLTANDLQCHGICPNLINFEERHTHFAPVKFNLDLGSLPTGTKTEVILFLDVLIYKLFEELLDKPSLHLSVLDGEYNAHVAGIPFEFKKQVVQTWVRFASMVDKLSRILSEYDEIYPNMIYYKSARGQSPIRFTFKVDALLRKADSEKIDLLVIVPYCAQTSDTQVISNISTMMDLDYLLDADLPLGKIIEFSYSGLHRDYYIRNVFPKKNVLKYSRKVTGSMDNKKPNLFFCNVCPYKTKCKLVERLE
jgi:hypothetical protein